MVKKQDTGQPEPGGLDAPPEPADKGRRPDGETPEGASRDPKSTDETAEGNDPATTRGDTIVREVGPRR
jgi:hypothetical protein